MSVDSEIFKRNITLNKNHEVLPEAHLNNERDNFHFQWAQNILTSLNCKTVLDIGCYDGWLDFLLIKAGFQVQGIELSYDLVQAAERYALANNLDYKIDCELFHNWDDPIHFDATIFFEVLEHVPLDLAKDYIYRASNISHHVLISLPDVKNNPQHLWDPTEDIIYDLFEDFDPVIKFQEYENKTIPPNWLIFI